jgi:hypothetical protein
MTFRRLVLREGCRQLRLTAADLTAETAGPEDGPDLR